MRYNVFGMNIQNALFSANIEAKDKDSAIEKIKKYIGDDILIKNVIATNLYKPNDTILFFNFD